MTTTNPHGKSVFLENDVWFGCVAWNIDGSTLTAGSSVRLDFGSSSTHITISNNQAFTVLESGLKRVGVASQDIDPGSSGIILSIGRVEQVNCGREDSNGDRSTITGTWIDASPEINAFDGTFRNRVVSTVTSMIGLGFIMQGLTSTQNIADVFLTMRRI